MRDSLNLIQGNDFGATWLGHHDDLLLSFALVIWNGKSKRLTHRRFYRSYAKPESCEENDRCLFALQNQWIFPNLVRRQEKFCNACEDDRVLECEIR